MIFLTWSRQGCLARSKLSIVFLLVAIGFAVLFDTHAGAVALLSSLAIFFLLLWPLGLFPILITGYLNGMPLDQKNQKRNLVLDLFYLEENDD